MHPRIVLPEKCFEAHKIVLNPEKRQTIVFQRGHDRTLGIVSKERSIENNPFSTNCFQQKSSPSAFGPPKGDQKGGQTGAKRVAKATKMEPKGSQNESRDL